jgi:DNA polymerase-3 subunit epsilon
MRQIVLDTETTGLEPQQGHRIIEIGCVELVNRRLTGNHYHQYLNPERDIEAGAIEVHGITTEFLSDKPLFKDIAPQFLKFIKGAELIIHNAPFDVGFINNEFKLLNRDFAPVDAVCGILDTLALARKLHPGQKNNLDALCKRYEVDNTHRELHGALLDAEILADVYLRMTGGQVTMSLGDQAAENAMNQENIHYLPSDRAPLPVIIANASELQSHQQRLAAIDKASEGGCVWLSLDKDELTHGTGSE